jgi:hypothetical protein
MSTSRTRPSHLLRAGAVGAVAATLVNAALFGAGRAADLAYVVHQSSTDRIRLVHVVSFSLETFAVGLVAAVVAARLGRSLRALQILGAVVAVLSTGMDVSIDATLPAKLTLACMHLVVGLAYVASLQVVRSARTELSPGTTAAVGTALEAAVAA